MKHKRQRARDVDSLIGEMGRERIALRAKRTTVVLLVISSLICFLSALGSLSGIVLPYAVGPSVVLILTSMVGLVLAVFESRNT